MGPVGKFVPADSRASLTRRGTAHFTAIRAGALSKLLHKSSRSAAVTTDTLDTTPDRAPGSLSDLAGSSISDNSGRNGERKVDDEKKTTKQIGDAGETVAANYLVRLGHEIINRNWRTKYCEIDIISVYKDTLYFTEVKYRKNANQGGGLAAITRKKQNQMAFAVKLYVQINHIVDTDLRLVAIDVTGVPPEVIEMIEVV